MSISKKTLILAPHTDDGELGCGATISKLKKSGTILFYAAFSICSDSVPDIYPKDILKTELEHSMNILKIPEDNTFVFDYRVRRFDSHRQDILDDLIYLRKKVDPDLVISPSSHDTHQDHSVLYEESCRAFKHISHLGYEMPWNTKSWTAHAYSKSNEFHVSQKIKALKAYQSQSDRTYMNSEYIKSLAQIRGQQIGSEYAESFEVINWIL